jgi:hypothetical protein
MVLANQLIAVSHAGSLVSYHNFLSLRFSRSVRSSQVHPYLDPKE